MKKTISIVLGDPESLKEHAELMRRYLDMEHDAQHGESGARRHGQVIMWPGIKGSIEVDVK